MEAMLKQMRENAAAKAAAVQQDQAPSVAALEEQAAALRDQYKAGGYSNIRNAEAYEMERPSTAAAQGQYDPNEHARKKKEAMEKASVLKVQRAREQAIREQQAAAAEPVFSNLSVDPFAAAPPSFAGPAATSSPYSSPLGSPAERFGSPPMVQSKSPSSPSPQVRSPINTKFPSPDLGDFTADLPISPSSEGLDEEPPSSPAQVLCHT